MRLYSKTKYITGLAAGSKLVISLLLLSFPGALFDHLYPFGLFLPFFTASLAYGDIPKALLVCLLVLSALSAGGLLLSGLCLIPKKGSHAIARASAITVCAIDGAAFIASLVLGPFSAGKIIGILFNGIFIFLLSGKKGGAP